MNKTTVYVDGTDQPGETFDVLNGFVSRCVSDIAGSDRMGCLPDAREVARKLNTYDALLESLRGMVRIAEAVRYDVGLAKNQLERLATAKALIAEADKRP